MSKIFLFLFPFIFVLAACGGTTSASSSTITMDGSDFTGPSSITVHTGDAVKFVFSGSSGTHYLVTGSNGSFVSEQGAPSELNNVTGEVINAGQTLTNTFNTAGTYHVTCTIHPNMNVTIVVQ